MTNVFDRPKCHQAADGLQFGFEWATSPEGDMFWRDIQDRLLEYAAGADPKEPLNGAGKPVAETNMLIVSLQQRVEAQEKQIIEMTERIDKLRAKLLAEGFTNVRHLRGL